MHFPWAELCRSTWREWVDLPGCIPAVHALARERSLVMSLETWVEELSRTLTLCSGNECDEVTQMGSSRRTFPAVDVLPCGSFAWGAQIWRIPRHGVWSISSTERACSIECAQSYWTCSNNRKSIRVGGVVSLCWNIWSFHRRLWGGKSWREAVTVERVEGGFSSYRTFVTFRYWSRLKARGFSLILLHILWFSFFFLVSRPRLACVGSHLTPNTVVWTSAVKLEKILPNALHMMTRFSTTFLPIDFPSFGMSSTGNSSQCCGGQWLKTSKC